MNASIAAWEQTFAKCDHLRYPDDLKPILQKVKQKVCVWKGIRSVDGWKGPISLPSWTDVSLDGYQDFSLEVNDVGDSQESQMDVEPLKPLNASPAQTAPSMSLTAALRQAQRNDDAKAAQFKPSGPVKRLNYGI